MTRTVLAVATAAIALCFAGAAVAAPPEGSLHLTLVSADEGGTGERSFFFTDTIYQNGKVVGRDRALCHFIGQFENPRCRLTLYLPGGNLFIFLRLTPDPRGNFTVTGGTGKYHGKTGNGIYRSLSFDTTRVVVWLTSSPAPNNARQGGTGSRPCGLDVQKRRGRCEEVPASSS